MVKLKLFPPLSIVLVLFSLSIARAEAEPSSIPWWPENATLDLGVRFSESKITVKDSGDTKLGELSSLSTPAPTFIFSTPFKTWGKSRLGYKLKTGFSWFTIKNQKVGNDLVDLGTSATGYTLYIAPTAGYLFGDPIFKNGKGSSLLFGLGVGAGYVIASGDLILTEKSTQDKHTFSFNRPSLAVQLVLEARRNNWNFDIQVGGPTITDGDFKYEIFDVSAHIAHTFRQEDFLASKALPYKKGEKPRHRTLSLFFGIRDLPILSNDDFQSANDKKSSGGGGLGYTFRPQNWPFGVIADLGYYKASPVTTNTALLSPGTVSEVTLEASLLESHLGLQGQNMFSENWSWSLGGGLAIFYTSVEGTVAGAGVQDSSTDFGYWLGGGVTWHINTSYSLSLNARIVSVQTELLNVFEENTKGLGRLGFNWHF